MSKVPNFDEENQLHNCILKCGTKDGFSEKKLAERISEGAFTPKQLVYKCERASVNRQWLTPLNLAIHNNHANIARALILRPELQEKNHLNNAFLYASKYKRSELIDILLQQPSVNINSQDINGWTALSCAVEQNNKALVEKLLNCPGIDVNLASHRGVTPLMRACNLGKKSKDRRTIMNLFLAHKDRNINLQDANGYTALMYASKQKCIVPVTYPMTPYESPSMSEHERFEARCRYLTPPRYPFNESERKYYLYKITYFNTPVHNTCSRNCFDANSIDVLETLLRQDSIDCSLTANDGKSAHDMTPNPLRAELAKLYPTNKWQCGLAITCIAAGTTMLFLSYVSLIVSPLFGLAVASLAVTLIAVGMFALKQYDPKNNVLLQPLAQKPIYDPSVSNAPNSENVLVNAFSGVSGAVSPII